MLLKCSHTCGKLLNLMHTRVGVGDRVAIAIYIASTFNFEHVNNIANVLCCTERALIAKMGGVSGGGGRGRDGCKSGRRTRRC
jgi:hypothetical protein